MNDGLLVTAKGERMGGEPDTYQEDQISAAEGAGLKHMLIELNPAFARGGQEEIRYTGVYVANSFEDGKDRYGLDNTKTIIEAGSLIFTKDARKKKWFADMLDDDKDGVLRGPGVLKDVTRNYTQYTKDGPVTRKHTDKNVEVEKGELLKTKGFNRDFLASHWSQKMFIIHDPEVRRDVENRYLMSIGKKPAAKAPVNEEEEMRKENERLKKDLVEKERQISTITKLKGRPANRSPDKGGIDDKHEKNDNDAAAGSKRVEQNGGQGDPPGTE